MHGAPQGKICPVIPNMYAQTCMPKLPRSGIPHKVLDAALQLTFNEADDADFEPFCIWIFRLGTSETIQKKEVKANNKTICGRFRETALLWDKVAKGFTETELLIRNIF